jgi:penicillin G amidase
MGKPASLATTYGRITIHRNEHGIPVIQAETRPGLFFGQGFVQARDRQIQTMLMKAIFTGRMSELVKADEEFIQIDTYMRRYGFAHRPDDEWQKMSPSCRTSLQAHADGINAWLAEHGLVWELRLAGFTSERWSWQDSLAIGRGFGFVGMGDSEAGLEKWLMQLLCKGTTMEQLKELFPSVCDPDFTELYAKVSLVDPLIPDGVRWRGGKLGASNNWVLAPGRSASGHALAAGDPHLDIDRMPAIWQEIVLADATTSFVGASLPGVPGGLLGRTRELSWTPTYSCMDCVDFRIEECRAGKYRRADGWREFARRTELLKLKGGGRRELVFLENENGVLEGEPQRDGHYLVENYAAREGCGASDFEGVLGLLDAQTVAEGMLCFQKVRAASFNWLLADRGGNIGYQMSGRHFVRPAGTSGLLPLPAWDERYAYRGYVEGDRLPQAQNPPEGFLVSANDDRNGYGTTFPCAIHLGSQRKDRITALLQSRDKWTAAEMGAIQNDLYSLQAEALLARFASLVPDTPAGQLLRDWDRRYTVDSTAAVRFERFYRALLRNTFGKLAWGTEMVDHLLDQTGVLAGCFHYFDRLLLGESAHWFSRDQVEQAARDAFAEALQGRCPPLGRKQSVRMGHLLFGGKLPAFLGFDGGPVSFPGSRSSPCQAQFFTDRGRRGSFCPSYRFLTDMGTDEAFTSLPGGATDRRFSRYYKNELDRYLKGEYKRLELAR